MTQFLIISTTIASFFYAAINTWLWISFRKGRSRSPLLTSTASFSILVCARNEENNIVECIQALLNQQTTSPDWDIWVAEDRSEDNTAILLAEMQQSYPTRLKIINIKDSPEHMSPKKYALSLLAAQAQGSIFLTTDADCRPTPYWAQSMIDHMTPEINMVLGRGRYPKPPKADWFWGFQALDFLSHAIVAAGGIGGGIPINSSGNSLAYRRDTFNDVGGFADVERISGGDDDLLMHKFHCKYPKSLRFNYDLNGAVHTFPQSTFKSFWEQRKRWASTATHYSWDSILLLCIVYLYYCSIGGLLILGLLTLNLNLFIIGLWAWILKTLADLLPMWSGAKAFCETALFKYYPCTALLHIPYVIAATAFGIIAKHQWKGKEFRG